VKEGNTYVRATLSYRISCTHTPRGCGDEYADEMVVELPMFVDSGGVTFSMVRTVRDETVRMGQRFRYGGDFLVPIDAPEEVVYSDIIQRARVIHQESGHCTGCPPGHHEVPFVAFVTSRGAVRSLTFFPNRDSSNSPPAVVHAAEIAIRRWKFEAARTENRRVADYVRGVVPVDSE